MPTTFDGRAPTRPTTSLAKTSEPALRRVSAIWCTSNAGGLYKVETDYTALWLQDTMTAGRWSLSAGLRLDLQGGRNPPGEVRANPALPDELPALTYDGSGETPDWTSLSPRLSASYAMDAGGRTLLRLSLGRFAEQVGVADVGRVNPLASSELLFYLRRRPMATKSGKRVSASTSWHLSTSIPPTP